MNAFDIVKTACVTEKGAMLTDLRNQYALVVDRRANKIQIRYAVEELFKVKVLNVNTMRVTGKKRRRRTRQAGKSPDWKKAVVTLKKGDKIELT